MDRLEERKHTSVNTEKELLNSTEEETQQGHDMMVTQVQYDCYKGEGMEMMSHRCLFVKIIMMWTGERHSYNL